MEDNPFGFNNEQTSDTSTFNPHIDPSLQSSTNSPYGATTFDPNQHQAIPFYAPHAHTSNTPYQGLNRPRAMQSHDVQIVHTPSRVKSTPQAPHNTSGGQFGVLRLSYPETPVQPIAAPDGGHVSTGKKEPAHFTGMKKVINPPNLQEWREKLFNVNEIIYLTEDEFQTYFPHVDNVYSHRSTQQYKRKPFVTSYWDCRLKGRPPGTPKSTDPNKKKRKRVARERDQCDVKIKITEYFPGAKSILKGKPADSTNQSEPFFNSEAGFDSAEQSQAFSDLMTGANAVTEGDSVPSTAIPGADGKRFYSIQRVNGTGTNGQDEYAGGHKHDLEYSDSIKKNSIIREQVKNDKDNRRVNKQKTYSKKATGAAAVTVKAHSAGNDLKFFAGCFCPFVQRVWIALEAKGMDYQYIEIDPYTKPKMLMDVSPQGLIPAIRHGESFSTHDSSVILEYLEDIEPTTSLHPPTAAQRAYARLWIDHTNKNFVPGFYALLQAQETATQLQKAQNLQAATDKLVSAADPQGPFFFGEELSMVDVQCAPWLLRFKRVLTPYRGWPEPEPGTRLYAWLEALETHPAVKATLSGDEVYRDSYERYAENRPGTSQVADAINEGRALP